MCLSGEILKAVLITIYLVSLPGEIKDPTGENVACVWRISPKTT